MQTAHLCAGDINKARVLVIGHDPRLQVSNTLAGNAFFANYYFKPIPTQGSESAKYMLAAERYVNDTHIPKIKYEIIK